MKKLCKNIFLSKDKKEIAILKVFYEGNPSKRDSKIIGLSINKNKIGTTSMKKNDMYQNGPSWDI